MLAQLTNVSLSFPDKKVLQEVSLTIYPGDRVALVGPNGAGKTSLFRLLTGRLEPDAGTVSRAGGVRIGYLEQGSGEPEAGSGLTCMEVALGPFEGQIRLEKRIEALAAELGREDAATSLLLEDLGEAQQRFEISGGYTFRARTEATLTGLGLPEDLWGRGLSGLSAGQRVRLALAEVLLEEHDLILFDEPTNHLDVPAREWLEEYLKNTGTAYVVASHDRRFLDAVADKVAHLDRAGRSRSTPATTRPFGSSSGGPKKRAGAGTRRAASWRRSCGGRPRTTGSGPRRGRRPSGVLRTRVSLATGRRR